MVPQPLKELRGLIFWVFQVSQVVQSVNRNERHAGNCWVLVQLVQPFSCVAKYAPSLLLTFAIISWTVSIFTK